MLRVPRHSQRRAQTIIEYVLLLLVVALPVAAALKSMMNDKDEENKNIIYQIVKDSYGEENRLGVIGRPYP